MPYLLSLLIGIVAGLRAMTAFAAVAWAMALGRLGAHHGWLAWLGYRWTAPILTLLAIGEFVTDQLPTTPSRRTPPQFFARIVIGLIGGAAIGVGRHAIGCAALGAIGAVAGTLSGSAARANLARAFVADRPAALIEDAIAVIAAVAIVLAL